MAKNNQKTYTEKREKEMTMSKARHQAYRGVKRSKGMLMCCEIAWTKAVNLVTLLTLLHRVLLDRIDRCTYE